MAVGEAEIPIQLLSLGIPRPGGAFLVTLGCINVVSFQHLLLNPTVDIAMRGQIPRKTGAFSVKLPCTGNLTGIASFSIGLEILSR